MLAILDGETLGQKRTDGTIGLVKAENDYRIAAAALHESIHILHVDTLGIEHLEDAGESAWLVGDLAVRAVLLRHAIWLTQASKRLS